MPSCHESLNNKTARGLLLTFGVASLSAEQDFTLQDYSINWVQLLVHPQQ